MPSVDRAAGRIIARGSEVLPAPPSARQLLWRLLRTIGRQSREDAAVPGMSVEVPAMAVDARRLLAYRELLGFRGVGLPPPYPQVQAAGLQIHLLTRPECKLSVPGIVHVRNTIRQFRALELARSYRVRAELLGGTPVQKGLEFAVATCYYDGDTMAWESVATGLFRSPRHARGERRPAAAREVLDRFEHRSTFDVPSNIGRRYGRISGDLNPIHLFRLTGRLFGHPGHIAHGMWSMARCLAAMQDELPPVPFEIDVQFKQRLLLPSRVSLLQSAVPGSIEFALTSQDRQRVHVRGSIRPVPAQAQPVCS